MGLRRVRDLNKRELEDLYQGEILQLIVDMETKKVYHVPSWMMHIQAAAELLKTEGKQLNKENAKRFISAYIEIEGKTVKDMNVGFSSLESKYKIHHSLKEKAEAEAIIRGIIRLSRKLKEVA